MGLFSRKATVNALEFIEDFYGRSVFWIAPRGEDALTTYAETVRKNVGDDDPEFHAVEVSRLVEELRASWLEVIGVVCHHRADDSVSVNISEFTKEYLAQRGYADTWETMGEYNRAVAQSATYGADAETRTGRFNITFINQMRTSLFDECVEKGYDSEAAARTANRVGSETAWKSGTTPGLLALELTKRLDHQGSDTIWTNLAAVAHGFYNGANEEMEKVKLVV